MQDFARLFPKTIQFRNIPPEIQLRIFSLFMGASPIEESTAIRLYIRGNLLRADKATYQDLASTLYRASIFRFRDPQYFVDSFMVKASQVFQQNIRYLDCERGAMADIGIHWGTPISLTRVRSMEAWANSIFLQLPGLKESFEFRVSLAVNKYF